MDVIKGKLEYMDKIVDGIKQVYTDETADGIKNRQGDRSKNATGERASETGYEQKGLYKAFFDFAGEISNQTYKTTKKSVLEIFNEKLTDLRKTENESAPQEKHFFFPGKQIDSRWYEKVFLTDQELESAKRATSRFIQSYHTVERMLILNNSVVFDKDSVTAYLNDYLDLCTVIFNSSCVHQNEMHTKKIAENILNVGLDLKRSCFGILSPFSLFTLLRTYLYGMELSNRKRTSTDKIEELDSRQHMFATYAVHSFSRFTTIEQKTFLVDYSRRKDQIICRNLDFVTSIENVKPIRLFEKITSFIADTSEISEIEDPNTAFVVKIGVFGFCSLNTRMDEKGKRYLMPEVDDLIYEVFSWYEDNLNSSAKKLSLEIDYYLVGKKKAAPKSDIKLQRRYIYNSTSSENRFDCAVTIHEAGETTYTLKKRKTIFNKKDLIFYIDCPWLSNENYDLLADGAFETYGKWLSFVPWEDVLNKSFEESPYGGTNVFSSLNDQLNRLSTKNIASYGKIVRTLNESFLTWLEDEIKKSTEEGKNKTVYLYSSSVRGVELSNYANIPLIREESYSNKTYSILRFSTRRNRAINLAADSKYPDGILISLWDFIKNYDISFAYIGLSNYMTKQFWSLIRAEALGKAASEAATDGDMQEEKKSFIQRDIISILRNVFFIIKPNTAQQGERHIDIQIGISEIINGTCISRFQKRRNVIKIIEYIKRIIQDVLFSDRSDFGSQAMRKAFANCLYNQGNTVNDVFFQYEYRKKAENKGLSGYDVTVTAFCDDTTRYSDINDTVARLLTRKYCFDKFGDKRLYKKLFEELDKVMYSSVSANMLLNAVDSVGTYVNMPPDEPEQQETGEPMLLPEHIQIVKENIKKVCELNGYIYSDLYRNIIQLNSDKEGS